MNKHKIVSNLAIAVFSLALASGLLINHNLEKHYFPGEYIPEENAYFCEEITDPTGLIKAHKSLIPSDPQYSTQKGWSMSNVGDIESTWSSYTGKGTTIAIIDDGFDVDHPEYIRSDGTSAILSTSRYYYANSTYTQSLYKSYSSEPNCIKEDWEEDGYGGYEWATHGTNTSTTAAAPINGVGGVGIAPDADILALKTDMTFVAIKGAIQYAISQGVDVINMSVGAFADFNFEDGFGDIQNPAEYNGETYTESDYSSIATYLNSVCQSAYNAGIIVVASAGNEATWHKSYPACNTKVIGVGALYKNEDTTLAPFTNYVLPSQTGEVNVDILAPGYVYTAHQKGTQYSPTHTYDDTAGTSFSSPIVAGAACLWKQKYPNGTPDQFLSQLQSTASNIGYYQDKYIPITKYKGYNTDIGPSNITCGQLNVGSLLAIDEPFVSTIQSSFSISVGEKKQIDLDTYNGSITYSSANTSIATVSNTGLVTGTGAGNTTITVTATKNGHTATTTINVQVANLVACTSLTANPLSFSIGVNETYQVEPTLVTTPSNASRVFLYESSDPTVAYVDEDTGEVLGVKAGTATISAVAIHGTGSVNITATVTGSTIVAKSGTIEFGNSDGKLNVNSTSTSGDDSLSNTWTVTTSGTTSFTQNADYSQIGSSKNPASSITFTMSLSSSVNFTSVSASLGGFSGTSGSVTIKVDSTTIGTGSLSGTSDVTVQSKSSCSGTTLTISITSISKGVKAYSISYFYETAGSSPATPTVSGVTVSPSSLSLDLYNKKTGNLSATVNGTNSPSQNVTWSTGNEGVVTVSSSGVVTAVTVGTTTITATSVTDPTKSGSCTVTVTDSTPAPKTLSSISISGYTTSLEVNSDFEFGGVVTANFSDSTSQNVTSSATFSGYNMAVAGEYMVTVSYTYSGTTKTATYKLTVTDTSSATTTVAYTIGWGSATGTAGTYSNFTSTSGSVDDLLSFSCSQNKSTNPPAYNSNSNELRLYYHSGGDGGSITIYPVEGITFTGFVMTTSTTPNVKYSVDGGTAITADHSSTIYTVEDIAASKSIKIQNANTSNTQLRIKTIALTYEVPNESDKVIENLTATYSGGDVFVGDSLDESKVSVTASYVENLYEAVALNSDEYELSGFTSITAGEKIVTVTYTGSGLTVNSPNVLTTTFKVTVITDSVTSVNATCSKSYHPGEKIVKSDIIVTLHYASGKQETTTDFTFSDDNYVFKYSDAPSGGTTGTKQFSITYGTTVVNFNVNVSRVANQEISESTTNLSSLQFNNSNLSKNSGTASPTSVTIGGVAFTITSNAYAFTTDNKCYLSFGKGIGSIVNTNAFVSDLISVSVTQKSGARQDGVLSISKDGSTWVTFNGGSITDSGYRYFKYEYTSASTASGAGAYSNLQSISFTLSGQDNATNVANYIMYEDTTNQCTTKLSVAIEKLNTMSSAEKTLFWKSNDYVISTARERLVAWAKSQGKTIDLQNDTFKINTNGLSLFQGLSSVDNKVIPIVGIISLISLTSIGGYLFIKKREE